MSGERVKIFAPCMQCQTELGQPSFEPIFVEYFDDRLATLNCSRGHTGTIILQSQKFEVLMESGANALLQGFTLEACSSFAAALERAIEFGLRVLCTAQGVSNDLWVKTFRPISKHSERQLGAFAMMHALAFGEPYTPNQKFAERRNRVIHQGEILNKTDATSFCSQAYDEIVKLTERINREYPGQVHDTVVRDMIDRQARIPLGHRATTTGTNFYNLTATVHRPFADTLAQFQFSQRLLNEAIPEMEAMFRAIPPKAAPSSEE